MLRKVVSALLVFVMLSSAVMPAMAAKALTGEPKSCEKAKIVIELMMQDKKNAEKIFENLLPETQQEVIELLKVKSIVVKTDKNDYLMSSPLYTGSKSVTITVEGKNAIGMTLWKYVQIIDWSFDGSKITSKFRIRLGTVYMPGWKFDGHIGNQESGGEGQWSYRAWTQGVFSLCLGGNIGCIQHAYPWIDMIVYGNGGWYGERGW